MCNTEESLDHFQMIEEGLLITLKRVMEMYDLTKDQVSEAVKTHQISKPLKRYGALYYSKDELDLYITNIREEEDVK